MAALLDVNCLIALVDPDHIGHDAMHHWFQEHASEGWATCPLTENGMVRVLSQPAYPSGRRSPADVIGILAAVKKACPETHEFWVDSISLTYDTLFHPDFVAGSKFVTDVYLLGLAMRNKARLVSLDRTLPWQAIRGGSAQLIERPE
jgi:toxin-antitoxin system PIN domain toxin